MTTDYAYSYALSCSSASSSSSCTGSYSSFSSSSASFLSPSPSPCSSLPVGWPFPSIIWSIDHGCECFQSCLVSFVDEGRARITTALETLLSLHVPYYKCKQQPADVQSAHNACDRYTVRFWDLLGSGNFGSVFACDNGAHVIKVCKNPLDELNGVIEYTRSPFTSADFPTLACIGFAIVTELDASRFRIVQCDDIQLKTGEQQSSSSNAPLTASSEMLTRTCASMDLIRLLSCIDDDDSSGKNCPNLTIAFIYQRSLSVHFYSDTPFFQNVGASVERLISSGYSHNDISPRNLMSDGSLIDCGLFQRIGHRLNVCYPTYSSHPTVLRYDVIDERNDRYAFLHLLLKSVGFDEKRNLAQITNLWERVSTLTIQCAEWDKHLQHFHERIDIGDNDENEKLVNCGCSSCAKSGPTLPHYHVERSLSQTFTHAQLFCIHHLLVHFFHDQRCSACVTSSCARIFAFFTQYFVPDLKLVFSGRSFQHHELSHKEEKGDVAPAVHVKIHITSPPEHVPVPVAENQNRLKCAAAIFCIILFTIICFVLTFGQ